MFSQIRFQAIVVALIPIAVLAAVFSFALTTRGTTARTEYWANHTRSVLAASDGLLAALTAENQVVVTYRRTADAKDTAAFSRTARVIATSETELAAAAASSPNEERWALSFVATVNRANAFLKRYLALDRRGDTAAMKAMAQAASTQKLAADLRDSKDAVDDTERRIALAKLAQYGSGLARFSNVLLGTLIAGILLFLISGGALGARISMRALRLRRNAEMLRRGERPTPLRGNDELAVADREYRAVLDRLRTEHNNAALLQRALLPQNLPTIPGIRIDASYAPSSIGSDVGGDWYDVFPLGDSRLGISVGDVAGHGLQAASTMALMRQSVRMAARLCDRPPDVLQVVNRVAYDDGKPLLTAFYGELSLATGMLRYSVAGHPTPITVRALGIVEQLPGEGLIIGAERRVEYREYSVQLDAGSALVLFTDGLIENGRKDGRDYNGGVERLLEVVNRQYYSAAENIAYAIQRDILQDRRPLDDAAILFIGITNLGFARATATKIWTVDARTASAARRVKRAFLWHLGEFTTDGADLSEAELIFGELVGNVARHTPGRAEIALEIHDKRALIHVCDEGVPIVHRRGDTPETFAENGRGLLLVESLARNVRIERTPRGNRVTAELPVVLERDVLGVVAPRRTHRRRTAHA